jgi:hypothetical protein
LHTEAYFFSPCLSEILILASIVSADKSAPHSHSTKYPPLKDGREEDKKSRREGEKMEVGRLGR